MVSGILVPQPGIEPRPLYWKHIVFTSGSPGKSQCLGILDEGDINSSFLARRVTPLIIHTQSHQKTTAFSALTPFKSILIKDSNLASVRVFKIGLAFVRCFCFLKLII